MIFHDTFWYVIFLVNGVNQMVCFCFRSFDIGISHEIFLKENPHGDECCIGLRTIFGAAEAMLLCLHLRIDTSRANAEDETTGNQLALDLQTVEGIELCTIFQW